MKIQVIHIPSQVVPVRVALNPPTRRQTRIDPAPKPLPLLLFIGLVIAFTVLGAVLAFQTL